MLGLRLIGLPLYKSFFLSIFILYLYINYIIFFASIQDIEALAYSSYYILYMVQNVLGSFDEDERSMFNLGRQDVNIHLWAWC